MGHKLFPYEPRPNQKVIVEQIEEILKNKQHLIVESGTGSGKTVCSLASCLEFALKNDKKVVYLTRTNSQQKQVITELRAINSKVKILGLGLQGRKNMCTLLKTEENMRDGTAEELSKLCGEKKKATLEGRKKAGCRYYGALINSDISEFEKFARASLPTVEEMIEHCREEKVCPYETNKLLLKEATVVTAPYIFFFSPMIRKTFLDWLGVNLNDVIVIVDESHNLPDYARELCSNEMSTFSLELAVIEARDIGDPQLRDDLCISDFCTIVYDNLSLFASEYVIDDDGLVPPNELETQLMSTLTLTSRQVELVIMDMLTHGEIVRERKRKKGKLPRSYIYSVGRFLQDWVSVDEEEYAKLVVGGDNPRLETYCLDPSKATSILNDSHASVHMSGTLSPLDEYRDSIGLPESSKCVTLPGPFPLENRKLLYHPDFTTKYEILARDETMLPRMKDLIQNIIKNFDKNTLVFFPSYSLLSEFRELAHDHGTTLFSEEKGMSQETLMSTVQKFKDNRGSVLFAVMGGRVSEGIDFPGDELEITVLVGIPYPKPTARQKSLFEYYEKKFGKGWDYTVKAPASRKLLQSIGRLYRTETDRGVAIILDNRTVQFRDQIKDVHMTENPIDEMIDFFNK